MKLDRMAVLPGPPELNEINGLECQPGVTAHTDSKGQSGEVSTPVVELLNHRVRINLTYSEFGQLRAVVDFITQSAGDKLTLIPPLARKFSEAASVIATW